jgi:hypothetical protein
LACSSDLVIKSMFELLSRKNDNLLKHVLIYVGGIISSESVILTHKCLEYKGLDRLGNVLNN